MIEKDLEPVRVSCCYNVNPDIIFNAWVNPDIIREWLFMGPSSEIVHIESYPKTGGSFSIIEFDSIKKGYIDHFGQYQEVTPPNRLVFTLSVPKHFEGETLVIIDIASTKDGTELRLTQTGVPKNVTEKNWCEMLQQLKVVIE